VKPTINLKEKRKMSEKQPDATPSTATPEPKPDPINQPAVASAVTPASAAEKSFMDRIIGVMQELVTKKFSEFEKAMDDKIAQILAQKELEVEQGLRKSLGLQEDPVVTQSQLIGQVRKMLLEANAPEKRSPTAATSTTPGPDGIQKGEANEIDKAFDDTLSSLGAVKKDVKP